MDLSHCHIQVRDIAAARRFYEGVFEFKKDFVCVENEVLLRNSADSGDDPLPIADDGLFRSLN